MALTTFKGTFNCFAASTAAQPSFLQRQNGLLTLKATTSIPCFSIISVARMLSNPPESNEIALTCVMLQVTFLVIDNNLPVTNKRKSLISFQRC